MNETTKAGAQAHHKALYACIRKEAILEAMAHPDAKHLSHELGLMRTLIQTRLSAAKTDAELDASAETIAGLLARVESLVKTQTKLDEYHGKTLSQDKAEVLLQAFINAAESFVAPDRMEAFSEVLHDLVAEAFGLTKDKPDLDFTALDS